MLFIGVAGYYNLVIRAVESSKVQYKIQAPGKTAE